MLDRSICEQYLESKTDPLVGTIEPSMYIGEFDWANLPAGSVVEKADVRPYVKEVFANLISVNCEACFFFIKNRTTLTNFVLSRCKMLCLASVTEFSHIL
jgi:Exocyst complex component Sec5